MAWLDRYGPPLPLRCRGSFHLYATRDLESGAPRVVAIPAPGVDDAAAAACLDAVTDAHRRVANALIPTVAERARCGDVELAAFACDAVTDLEAFLARLAESKEKIPYAEAMGFMADLGEALIGSGATIGRVTWADLLLGPDGRAYLIGFGHDVGALDEHGRPTGVPSVFVAPEVAAGAEPAPGADTYAIVAFQRSLLPYVELHPSIERIMRGRLDPSDAPLVELFMWVNANVLAAPAGRRATLEEGLARFRRAWSILGVVPDADGLRRRFARILGQDDAPSPEWRQPPAPELVIGPDAAWMRTPDGAHYRLAGRTAVRRMIRRLADAHARGGDPLRVGDLLEAGWPGERPLYAAGQNRVHVALSAIRKMGLRDALQRIDDGYRLDPSLRVCTQAPDAAE